MQLTMQQVLAHAHEFDLIHGHLEWMNLLLCACRRSRPWTFHGRLDLPWADDLLADPPPGLIAISQNQASTHPDIPWAGVVYNGLRLTDAPFGKQRTDALCFVGRVVPEKGIVESIEVAKATSDPQDRGEGRGRWRGTGVFRRGLPTRARAAGSDDRIPRRDLAGRARSTVRRELRVVDAGLLAGAVRPSWPSRPWRAGPGHRAPDRCATGDRP